MRYRRCSREPNLVKVSVKERLERFWKTRFCAALQNTSFGALEPLKFDDAMTTGNLRTGTSAMVFWLTGRDAERNRGQPVVSFTIFVCFLGGDSETEEIAGEIASGASVSSFPNIFTTSLEFTPAT